MRNFFNIFFVLGIFGGGGFVIVSSVDEDRRLCWNVEKRKYIGCGL